MNGQKERRDTQLLNKICILLHPIGCNINLTKIYTKNLKKIQKNT